MEKFLVTKTSTATECPEAITTNCESKSIAIPSRRKFRSEWLEKFRWLRNIDGRAHCAACDKFMLNHLNSFQRHEKQAVHIRNMKSKENQVKIDGFTQEKSNHNKEVCNAEYALIMFLVMHNLPFALMDFLPNLLRVCCPDSKIAKDIKCGRTKATQLTMDLGNKSMERIVSALRTTKFSLIVDETTDVANRKALVLVARYFHILSGIVKDQFLALIEIEKCDAESIYNVVKSFLKSNDIPIKNLIGLATDGANTMAGSLSGLKTRLNADTNFFYLKCTCHSLHLCSGYACKKLPSVIEMLCRNIYSYFAWSPKRAQELKEFQEYCGIKPHKILGISMTRWLSLEKVIVRILEQWDALLLFFLAQSLEVNNIKPKEVANLMAEPENKIYFYFLSYILKILNDLNTEFQSESIRLPFLYLRLESSLKLILNNFVTHDYLKDLDLKNLNVNHLQLHFLPLDKVFIGLKAQQYMNTQGLEKSKMLHIKQIVREFYLELVFQIVQRFDFGREDIKSLILLTPTNINTNEESDIVPLINNFEYLCESDPDEIISQWAMLKLTPAEFKKEEDIVLFWERISKQKNGLGNEIFKDLVVFVRNIFSLPHSSASAERKFFAVSLIKTKLRNKLEFDSVSSIMLCKELCVSKDTHYVWSAKDL